MTTAPVRYRNSELRLIRQCPFAYEQQYVKGLPGAPAAALEGGRNIHAAVQLLVRRIVMGGPIDVYEIAFEAVRGRTSEYADALAVLIRLQEAIGVEFDIDPKKVVGLEELLTMPLRLRDGTAVEFFGTPDLVEKIGRDAVQITDWKTHRVVELEEEFRADWQLKRYALLVSEQFPAINTFRLVKRFVRFRNMSHEMVITRDELTQVREALISEIMSVQAIRAAGTFEATPGDWCGLCSYHHSCPIVRQYLDAGFTDLVITSDEHAQRIAGDAHALECAAAAHKARLKNYLGGAHPSGTAAVPLPGGGEYGFIPMNHRDVELEELCDVLVENGIEPPKDLGKTDLAVLDKLMTRLPEDVAMKIEAITHRWQTSQMRYRSAGAMKKAKPMNSTAAAGAPQDLFG